MLDNSVVLQGDLYPAAPYVAFDLVRLLAHGVPEGSKLPIYGLLYDLRNGQSITEQLVAVLDYPPGDIAENCRRIVDGSSKLILPDIVNPSRKIRMAALDLVASMEEPWPEIELAIGAALRVVEDEDVRQDLWRVLADE